MILLRRCAALVMLVLAGPGIAQGITQGFNPDGTPYTAPGEEQTPDEALDDPNTGVPLEQVVQQKNLKRARGAALRGLDTLNGTVVDFSAREGEVVIYGRLDVTLTACWYPEGNADGEAYAFLQIRDRRDRSIWFSGWMFASSPALSALDHPRYDVWVLRCSTD